MDGRVVPEPERHDADQLIEIFGRVVCGGVDPPDAGELAEPEIALLLAGAQEVVAPTQLVVEDLGGEADRLAPGERRLVARLFENLQVKWVVHVSDEDLLRALEPGVIVHDVALEDEHVAPRFQLVQLGVIDMAYRKVGVGETAQRGGHELHIVLA